MEIAKRLRPFGVKILATKRNWSSNTVSCGKLQQLQHHSLIRCCVIFLSQNIAIADLDGLVDKKGGPEDMYELVQEADIVITCMTLNNESVNSSLCSFI